MFWKKKVGDTNIDMRCAVSAELSLQLVVYWAVVQSNVAGG
jgi:hypothetical protein